MQEDIKFEANLGLHSKTLTESEGCACMSVCIREKEAQRERERDFVKTFSLTYF